MWYTRGVSSILTGGSIILMCCAASQVQHTSTEPPIKIEVVEPTAGDYLAIGFEQFENKLWSAAAESFKSAISTNGLNNAGRAAVYWHIAQCYLHLSDIDKTVEALFYFSVVADSILHPGTRGDFFKGQWEFAEQFSLYEKLDFALYYINMVWDSRHDAPVLQ